MRLPHRLQGQKVKRSKVKVTGRGHIVAATLPHSLFRYASPRLWNQLPEFIPSASSFSSRFTSSSTSQLISVIIHNLVIHHSFNPGSKPTFSTNSFHHRFLLPTGLPHDNGTGPDLTLIILFLAWYGLSMGTDFDDLEWPWTTVTLPFPELSICGSEW